MKFYPGPADLLAAARTTFIQRVLPALPPEAKYDGLMVANALGIVARELEGEGPPCNEAANRALAEQIRAGHFDEAQAMAALIEQLMGTLSDALRVDNPRALKTQQESG